MREDNLLCVRKRNFVVTTESKHGKRIFPKLAHKMVLIDLDQLWVADTTSIRLRDEFVSPAVMLVSYSRRVIGWALDRDNAASESSIKTVKCEEVHGNEYRDPTKRAHNPGRFISSNGK